MQNNFRKSRFCTLAWHKVTALGKLRRIFGRQLCDNEKERKREEEEERWKEKRERETRCTTRSDFTLEVRLD